MKKNVAIAMGGFSSEYRISINSGNVVYNNLDRSKYNPYRVHILQKEWFVIGENDEPYPINRSNFTVTIDGKLITFDCVFNTIHGTPGENGLLQAYLELLDIPQTSCDFYQSALTFNKRDLISVLKPFGIKTAENFFVDKGDEVDPEEIIAKVGLPCFVKANKAGSSFGITKVKKSEGIIPATKFAFKEDDEIIIESFLDGIEVSVGVITHNGEIFALPVTEIVSENEFFDYEAKYLGKSQEITPARISEEQTKKVQEIAKLIYRKLKMKGFSRSEFIFHNDEPHFIEMNTNPGLSEASILPQQAQAAGISLEELFGSAIETALKY
ncbi:D-alanine--D-alanine ligase [Salinimicrobium sediminilitoris]|uniref:D-alanine--D-alanine ligase n=1 Tax=Salinimicrobium sediminilitoris TaxID=2876715 RepID=UPI001E4F2BB5|nr:D-alanine--D-alanine ligase [Salinimicrobium sediminilitoris]MCC8360718.1 D-alanine--D-alanine ligase [Salinimicrobium sediminilitoris]